MSAEAFIDTNVFVYQLEALDIRKTAIADKLIGEAVATGNACISFQVAQECLNTVLRKAEIPLDTVGARRYPDAALDPLQRVTATSSLYHRALDSPPTL
jgi:predicted nucleic acid-binding protein